MVIPQAKPFIKWVGGKGQLLSQLDELLPSDFADWEQVTYIEPFVGSGAMLFYMLQTYPNIERALINDINTDLTKSYKTIKNRPHELIHSLSKIQEEYYSLVDEADKKAFYLTKREQYNQKGLSDIENSTLFIFLNRTCFNGLYRVNKSGGFNVPFGRYVKPKICDEDTILADSQLLQKVEILNADFTETFAFAEEPTLFYFDPPYRPLSKTSSFNDYSKEAFDDAAQVRLKEFCDLIDDADHHFMLSNSDSKIEATGASFFDDLYKEYTIERVWASRQVNANPNKRGKLKEIVVRNYSDTKKSRLTHLRPTIPNLVFERNRLRSDE